MILHNSLKRRFSREIPGGLNYRVSLLTLLMSLTAAFSLLCGAAALTLGAGGVLSLTILFLMAPTHTVGGVNYADAWHFGLTWRAVG